MQRAARHLDEFEDRVSGKPQKKILDAVSWFRAQHEGNADETKRRCEQNMRYFTEFCAREALTYVDQMNLEAMDRYVASETTSSRRPRKRLSYYGNFSSSAKEAMWYPSESCKGTEAPEDAGSKWCRPLHGRWSRQNNIRLS